MDSLISFFISSAHAQAAPANQPPSAMSWIFLAVMFVALYVILIRPQQKRMKEHRNMVGQLSKGDEVATGGGIIGKITKIDDSFVKIEIAKDVEITVQKNAIQSLMPKGTYKSA